MGFSKVLHVQIDQGENLFEVKKDLIDFLLHRIGSNSSLSLWIEQELTDLR